VAGTSELNSTGCWQPGNSELTKPAGTSELDLTANKLQCKESGQQLHKATKTIASY